MADKKNVKTTTYEMIMFRATKWEKKSHEITISRAITRATKWQSPELESQLRNDHVPSYNCQNHQLYDDVPSCRRVCSEIESQLSHDNVRVLIAKKELRNDCVPGPKFIK